MGTTYTRQQAAYYDVEDRDDLYETRMPSSARRYKPYETVDDPLMYEKQNTSSIQRRRSSSSASSTSGTTSKTRIPGSYTTTTRQPSGIASGVARPTRTVDVRRNDPIRTHGRGHSKRFYPTLIIGMIVAIALLVGLTSLVSWWQGFHDDMAYGYPRTFHADAVVGHNDTTEHPTHFVFINLHGHIQVIEIPGGDVAKTRIFTGPTLYGSGQDRIPVTGDFVSQQGKINLIVHVGSQDFPFINDGNTFHPR